MRSASLLAASALLCLAGEAGADPSRHAVCHEDPKPGVAQAPAPERRRPANDWLPLPRKRPPRLEMAKLEVFDLPESDPLPTRRSPETLPTARPQEPKLVLTQSRNTWRCIGVPRGTPGILRVIGAAPGTRFYGHPYVESWRQDNMHAAGELRLTGALPLLRRELERPMPKNVEPWQAGELRRSKHAAARALADLGDTASAPKVLALLRSFERDGFNLWRDTLDALPRLDPALAQQYALELIERARREPSWLSKNPTLYTDLLPWVTTPSEEARAVLARVSGMLTKDDVDLPRGSGGCEFLAARVRLGDAALTTELRAELSTDSLSTQRAAACYSTLMPDLYPGRDASEMDVLLHRHRYEAILSWLERTRTTPRSDATDAARIRLLLWLQKRSSDPEVAGDRSHRSFVPDRRAMHLAALSALGDAGAQRKLTKLATDADDDGTAPWVAIWYMLKLDLPGARDLAAARLLVAQRQHMRRFSRDSWPRRGALIITEHGRVVEELASRGDHRFVLGLLDQEGFTRTLTTTLLARRRPASACATVGDAARGAKPEAVDHAFWALSLLGDQCRATMLRLAKDPSQPKAVRGMANEHLAMLRDPSVPEAARALSRADGYGATVWRARVIFSAPE